MRRPATPKKPRIVQAIAKSALSRKSPLFELLRSPKHDFSPEELGKLLRQVDQQRVFTLANALDEYIRKSLPDAIAKRKTLPDYRINPYVLMTSASVAGMVEMQRLAAFISDTKLYMGLETSFGKSVESIVTKHFPIGGESRWEEPAEKRGEFDELKKLKLSRQENAARRNESIWREVDRSCVFEDRRYLVSIKSGPNCINDTQVEGMKEAIARLHSVWWKESKKRHPEITGLDVVIGLTYGTDQTTNNKENLILAKLLNKGFVEEDRNGRPGVLVDAATGRVRVYRRIGQDFWAMIGNPAHPEQTPFVFLEMLFALAKALGQAREGMSLEDKLNTKVKQLQAAFEKVVFPAHILPEWVSGAFNDLELSWLAAAITTFFDKGL